MGELQERALWWLQKVVENRGSMKQASRDLGHAENWVSRQIARKAECNWDFGTLGKMAQALGMSEVQVDEAIRLGIIPASKPVQKKPRAKQRRARREPEAAKKVHDGTSGA